MYGEAGRGGQNRVVARTVSLSLYALSRRLDNLLIMLLICDSMKLLALTREAVVHL